MCYPLRWRLAKIASANFHHVLEKSAANVDQRRILAIPRTTCSAWSLNRQSASDGATFVALGKFPRQRRRRRRSLSSFTYIFLASIFYEELFRSTLSGPCRADRYIPVVTNQRTRTGGCGPIASPIRRAIRNHRWHGASSGCWQRAPLVNAGCDEITLCQRSQKLPG